MNLANKQLLLKLPQQTLVWTLAATALLVVLHYSSRLLEHDLMVVYRPMVNMNLENNIPTAFATLIWAMTAISALACYKLERRMLPRPSLFWLLAAAIFAFAAVDDFVEIHEKFPEAWNYVRSLNIPLPDWGGESNMLWQILYVPPVLLFFAKGLSLVWKKSIELPSIRISFVSAIACFAVAVGCECIADSPLLAGQLYQIPFFRQTSLLYCGEEIMEDIGTICLLFTFMKYATSLAVRLTLEKEQEKLREIAADNCSAEHHWWYRIVRRKARSI